MQSTGHTSTHAVSFVPMHGSQMMYATRGPPTPNRLSMNRLLYLHPAVKPFVVPVEVADRRLRVRPAVVALAVVEIDEPEPFRFEPKRAHLLRPAVHEVA